MLIHLLDLYCFSVKYFFFSCYVHHRDLHSFPTRRSSDLEPERRIRRACIRLSRQRAARLGLSNLPTSSDRKSTRLNSSHVEISYAVFCLKKKRKVNASLTADQRPAEDRGLPCHHSKPQPR